MAQPWLVVIDMQNVFAHGSPWASPEYATASQGIHRLLPAFGERVVYTRYVAPAEPEGAWVPYFELWPFALVPEDDHLYDFAPDIDPAGHAVVTRTTFGKWSAELAEATQHASEIVLTGVSTDCCVISTALPMADDRFLVVGLGNPGPRYAGARHNAGFLVADLLAERMGGRFKAHRSNADVLEGRLAGAPVVVAKPRSYMNESGAPVVNAARFFKVPVEWVVVVHDELDLPYGSLRLKRGGGDGGHNGLRSVTAALGSKEYLRVRFGIGQSDLEFSIGRFVGGGIGDDTREG